MFKHGGWIIALLLLLSGVWIVGWAYWGFNQHFLELNPNEVGDFLAGVFAPLAFAWFTAAVFFQRNEIRLSTVRRQSIWHHLGHFLRDTFLPVLSLV